MLCSKCKQQEAVLAVTEVKGKEKIQMNLCERCAQNHSLYIEQPAFSYSMQSLLGQFLETLAAKAQEIEQKEEAQAKCPHCGISYQEFRKTGRLGCAHDYEIFMEQLLPLFNHIHGDTNHRGKTPATFAHPTNQGEKKAEDWREIIQNLQCRLKAAVAEERYEDAAQFRDEIRRLEERHINGSDEFNGQNL